MISVLKINHRFFGPIASIQVVFFVVNDGLSSHIQVLALHIIPGQALKSTDLSDGQSLRTLSGEEVTFSIDQDIDTMSVTVPSGVTTEVILKNLEACSAVVHVIGTMLLPEVQKV